MRRNKIKVTLINPRSAYPLLIDIHYAARIPSISTAFGLFDNDDRLEGVCTFGTPLSTTLQRGICGEDYAKFVLELNRLCLRNNKKNMASFFILAAMKILGNKIIVSYADTAQNHLGTVYQATNFIYTGLSTKFTDWALHGDNRHQASIGDEFRGQKQRLQKLKDKYGDRLYSVERSRKHRYIKFIGDKRFCKTAKKNLKYKTEKYPKNI